VQHSNAATKLSSQYWKKKAKENKNWIRRRRGQPTQQYLWLLDHCRHCCWQKKTTTTAKQSLFLDPSISDAVGQAAYSKIYSRWQVLSIRSTKRRKPTVAIATSTECASLPTHNQTKKKEKKRRTKHIRAKRTGSSAILFTMTHSRSWRKRRRSIRFTFPFCQSVISFFFCLCSLSHLKNLLATHHRLKVNGISSRKHPHAFLR